MSDFSAHRHFSHQVDTSNLRALLNKDDATLSDVNYLKVGSEEVAVRGRLTYKKNKLEDIEESSIALCASNDFDANNN